MQPSFDARIARMAGAQLGVFARAQAVELGATSAMIRHRIAAREWERVSQRVYRLASHPPTWQQALLAGCFMWGRDAVASHRASARLWELEGITDRVLELTIPRSRHRGAAADGYVIHWRAPLSRADLCRVGPIPATTAARTIVDLAAVTARASLEIALDDALRRRIVDRAHLKRAMARAGAFDGVGVLRALLGVRTERAVPQSPLETRAFRLLVDAGIRPDAVQHPVRHRGRLLGIVDFAYPDARVAVEVDGFRFHSERTDWARDRARLARMVAAGWLVVPVTHDDVTRRRAEVVRWVKGALAQRR